MSNSDMRSSASACLLHPQDLHVISACPQFLEMDVKDRIELVKEKGRAGHVFILDINHRIAILRRNAT